MLEAQRHQRGGRRDDAVAELFGQFVAKRAGADGRHRQAAGGHHQVAAGKAALVGAQFKARSRGRLNGLYTFNHAFGVALHTAFCAFVLQHINNVLRAAVAKKLAFVLFVIGYAVVLEQSGEIGAGVAR